MAKKKFYAVRKGRETGIFDTWPEAQKLVSGFPGAEYKSFKTREEAEAFLNLEHPGADLQQDTETLNAHIEEEISTLSPKKVIAFIDGSYGTVNEREKYSFGAVLITDEQEVELYRGYLNPDWIAFRNVAGEIQGAMEAISWALEHGKTEIDLYYDYQGIEKWAVGDWRANSAVAITYVEFIKKVKDQLTIRFFHVPAHTGINYNERVDDLAKDALKSQDFRTHDKMSFYLAGLAQEAWVALYESLRAENAALGIADDIQTRTEETGKDYLHRIILAEGEEQVAINLYGRDKAYVQGHPESRFYQRVVLLAIGQLETRDRVLTELNRLYQGSVDKESFAFAGERLLLNVPKRRVSGTLWCAVYGVLFQGVLKDYTPLLIPIYRALRAVDATSASFDEMERLYAQWAQKKAKEPLLPDLNEARNRLEIGLHAVNHYFA